LLPGGRQWLRIDLISSCDEEKKIHFSLEITVREFARGRNL